MKIAIAGYGVEGEASYRYFASDENNEITIVDEKQPKFDLPIDSQSIIGEGVFENNLWDFDLVIRTASLPPNKIKTNGKVWSATNEFFSKCPAQIIGVTGTKGKGTIASLITHILESADKRVWLLGNIGIAALDHLSSIQPDDIIIYELSSFQLWDLKFSPHISVVSLIEPEHLDVHEDFEDYVNAKSNIRRHQKNQDTCIYHPYNLSSKKVADASDVGEKYRYGVFEDGGVYFKDKAFYQFEQKICSIDALQLIGKHNIENACAAISVAKIYKVDNYFIELGLKSFPGLPHRLEFVREINGVKYYNDSFSSSTPATIAAIYSFDQPEVLIMGGIDRGGNFNDIAEVISEKSNIKSVILIGKIRNKLAQILSDKNPDLEIIISESNSMIEIVNVAKDCANQGDVIVLSPGCASFDMFKDFYDRGDQFRKAVNNL